MTPHQAKMLWNQMVQKRESLRMHSYEQASKGEGWNAMVRRGLERDADNLEGVLRREGRCNADGEKMREAVAASAPIPPSPRYTFSSVGEAPAKRPRHVSTRVPNIPSRDVPWDGETEPMRKVVGWGTETLGRGGCFVMRDASFDGLVQALRDVHGMGSEDARDVARHIWLRRGMVDPVAAAGGNGRRTT